MPAYRGMARNADLAELASIVPSGLQGLYLPSGVTVSAGTNVNGWTDSSGNARHLTVGGGTPQKSSVAGGIPSVLYNGTTDFLIAPTTWASYLPGNVHWLLEVWFSLAAGGANGAANAFNNKGPGPSDPAQFINIAQFRTFGGVDFDQSEVWINGATAKDAFPQTTDPGGTTRTLHLFESWIDSGAVMTARCGNGSGLKAATVAGVTGYGLKTGTPVFGKTGAAVPFLNCQQSLVLMASISPTAIQQANARKIICRAYGIEW